jgi:hypothetical protein
MRYVFIILFALFVGSVAAKVDGNANKKSLKNRNGEAGGIGGSQSTEDLLKTLSLHEIEYKLAEKEVLRTKQIWRQLQSKGYEIYGFYHTNIWKKHWKAVLKEQLYLLDGKRKFPTKKQLGLRISDYSHYEYRFDEPAGQSEDTTQQGSNHVSDNTNMDTPPSRYASLLAMSSGLYLNVVGNDTQDMEIVREFVDSLHLVHRNKIIFNFNFTTIRDYFEDSSVEKQQELLKQDQLSCGEYPTVMAMRGFCRNFVFAEDQKERKQALVYKWEKQQQQQLKDGGLNISALIDIEEVFQQLLTKEGYPTRLSLMPEHTDLIEPGKYSLPLDFFSSRIPQRDRMQHREGVNHEEEGSEQKLSSRFTNIHNHKKKKALVYYFHLKGSCCWKDSKRYKKPNPSARWREYMNAFNLEFPSICLRALGHYDFSVCGTEYQDEHYSGNYWWSDCEHLSQLPPMKDRYSWIEAEYLSVRVHDNSYYMQAFARHCAYSMFSSSSRNITSLYDEEITREMYLPRLWDLVVKSSLHAKKWPTSMQQDKIQNVEYPGKYFALFLCVKLHVHVSY